MPRDPEGFIESVGALRAARHLRMMGVVMEDPRPFWNKLQDEIAKLEAAWFDSRGHGEWPPLADETRARKAEQGLDPRVMVATGALRRSLTAGHTGKSRRVGKTIMHFGTNVYYARMHSKARPVLIPTDRKFRKMVTKQLVAYAKAPTTRQVSDS